MIDTRKGFALVYFLLISLIIVMMTGAVLTMGHEGLAATRSGVDANRALYAAEAGMTDLIAKLERDPAFSGSADELELSDKTSRYSFEFQAPSAATALQCVNNLAGDAPVDSYRGPGTVPPHSALLVVTGRSGLSARTVEALVVSGLDVIVDDAITATGKITMEGDVRINGRKSLTDTHALEANMHTNSRDSGYLVTYRRQESSDAFEVTGQLTASSSEPAATVFDVAGAVGSSKLQSNTPQKNLPTPNIVAMVSDGAGSPGPAIPALPGEVRLAGTNHYGTDVTVNGDLVLEEGTLLLVDGNLTVNGSISGKGQVVVTGNTEFYGDAEVAHGLDDYVSLLSQGHVVLKGFQGQRYMNGLAAANPTLTRDTSGLFAPFVAANPPSSTGSPFYPPSVPADLAWSNLQLSLSEVQQIIQSAGSPHDGNALREYLFQRETDLDALMAVIANHDHGATSIDDPSSSERTYILGLLGGAGNLTLDNSSILATYMRDQGGGPLSASTFLQDRFVHLGDLFRQGQSRRDLSLLPAYSGPAPGLILASWGVFENYGTWDPATGGGIFDSMQSQPVEGTIPPGLDAAPPLTAEQREHVLDIAQGVLQFEIDRLGAAHFKGVVYTSGAFVATDDVIVRGSVLVNGNPKLGELVIDEGTFQPGDVGLFGFTTLTYVEEFFHDGVHNLAGNGALDIKRWTAR